MTAVTLQIPGRPEYVRVARLAISATASCAGFAVDQIDEIKQSVGEACSNAVQAVQRAGEGQVTLRCDLQDEQIVIEVFPVGGLNPAGSTEDARTSFQYFLIKTLMDEVEITTDGNGLETIKMTRSLTR
ncbi:MAG: ATP-binding protein [Armatimonadota bacterium]|nr:ATP-binding protein [Armatimonadota bacterium]